MNRWLLSEDNDELIHRVFGGTAIIDKEVTTHDELDFYPTTTKDAVVIVSETHAYFWSPRGSMSFDWDEPLTDLGKLKFIGVWGEGYMKDVKAYTETINLDFICTDKGYLPKHIAKAKTIFIGESFNVVEFGAIHSIVRIE